MATGTNSLTHLDWQLMVEERNAWVAHNFPDPEGKRTPLDSILGCIEELGELTHHHLKQAQSIRGDDDHHEAEAKDAIGDLSVYLMGVMSHYRRYPISPLTMTDKYDPDYLILRLAGLVGNVAHEFSYFSAEGSFIAQRVSQITTCLERYCQARDWDYGAIVKETWNSVKKRDWIKFPHDGLTT